MSIKESMLNIVSDLAQNDYIRAVTYGGYSRRVEVSELAKSVVEDYTGSSLAGENQSVQGAFSALETEIQNVEQDVTAEINDAILNILPTDTAAGEIASFPDGSDLSPALSVVAGIEPVQSGSGTPSPTNVRPISGHDEVVVSVNGINQWDEEWELGGYSTTDGQKDATTNRIRSKNYIPCLPNTTYYFNHGTNAGNVFEYDANKNLIDVLSSPTTFTTSADTHYLTFYMGSAYGTTYNNDISINYPATDHDYHAYVGTDYTTTLPSTTYGGTLDVVSGLLVVDKVMANLGDATWTYSTALGNIFIATSATLPAQPKSYFTGISDRYTYGGAYTLLSDKQFGYVYVDALCIKDSAYTDPTAFKSAMNGAQLVYEIANPQTYQLTETQVVELFKGYNNVFSEAGDMSVTYKADIQLYVDKQTNELRVAILALA